MRTPLAVGRRVAGDGLRASGVAVQVVVQPRPAAQRLVEAREVHGARAQVPPRGGAALVGADGLVGGAGADGAPARDIELVFLKARSRLARLGLGSGPGLG